MSSFLLQVHPELMTSFSDLLEKIFQEHSDNWEKIYEELEKLRQRIKDTMKEEDTLGLDKRKEIPFFHTLKTELFGQVDAKLNEDQTSDLIIRWNIHPGNTSY